ncbi:thiopeptide maturation pyridine synthase [Nocardiopsis xinjiangensis]|uniref:thiopeptide maturation pyridine synthase n=1 Tax=Nocardiopsis xinjiangensis TaxID=124285 RepID=UPI000344CAEE|nr:thiopeptide maturation pyridine synthase [Nocardiopsis xinjiangensis]
MNEQSTAWHTCTVRYYARDRHDDLILDCVGPALEAVAGTHSGTFFDRGWHLGPHIRLNVAATPRVWAEHIRPTLEEHIGAHLSGAPSLGCPDPEREALQHRRLAVLEHVEGPLLPWYPDNSLQFGVQEDRSRYLGGNTVLAFMNDFHADTNALVLRMLDRIRAQDSRQELCLGLMFALAHTQCPPVSRGFLSYHSHAEAFLANCSAPQRTRTAFEERYTANSERSARILDHALRSADPTTSEDVLGISEWIGVWETYRARAHRLLELGQADFDDADAASAQDARASGFLEGLQRSGEWDEIRTAPWFRCYRLLLNATYAQMARVGVGPLERYLLCHTAARTVEEAMGVAAPESAATWGSGGA